MLAAIDRTSPAVRRSIVFMGTSAAQITPENEAMVRRTALALAKQLGILHAVDDLIGYGFEGLAEALPLFDPSRGVPLNGYAYQRVRRRILYGAQHVGGMSRKTYARALRMIDALVEEAGDAIPKDEPPREAEDVGVALDNLFGQAASTMIVAQIADEQTTPETKLIDEMERARVRRALARVPERERALLRAHYFDDRVLEDIGAELGVQRSGAHKMHTRALGLMREALG